MKVLKQGRRPYRGRRPSARLDQFLALLDQGMTFTSFPAT